MIQSDPQLELPADLTAAAAPPAEVNGAVSAPFTQAIRKAAARGAAWTVFGFATRLILRFGFNLLLTRLVAPKVFGVMALINLVVQSLHMFSDLGISQCVTHHLRGDESKFLNTAWTLQVFRGFGLWLLAAAFAGPAAWFYQEPALAWLIPIAGSTAALDGLYSTAVFTLNRRLVRGRLVLLELVPYIIVMSAAIGFIAGVAARHPQGEPDSDMQNAQIQILVWANVAIVGIQVAVSYWLLRGHRHRFMLERDAARELLHFGGWVFVSTACGFLASQADQLVIGKVGSLAVLGVYRLASQLAMMPSQFIAALCAQLIFPLYSKLFRSGSHGNASVAGVHRLLGLLAGWMVSGLIVAGPTLVRCLYPDRFQDAASYIQLLAAAAWFTMLQCTGEAVLLARGQAKLMAIGQVVKLIALVPLMYFGYEWGWQRYGTEHAALLGLVAGFGVAEALRYFMIAVAVRSLGQSLAFDDIWLTLLTAGTAALWLLSGPAIWGQSRNWVQLIAETLAVTAVWASVYSALHRRGLVGLG